MKKRIQVMIEPELYSQIEVEAKKIGLSLSSYIRFRLLENTIISDWNNLKDTVNIDANKLISNLERTKGGRNKLD